MAGPLANLLFFFAAIAIAVAHVFIVRSTLRGLRTPGTTGTTISRAREVVWALLPVLAITLLLVWTWATMHPGSMTFTLPGNRPPIGGITT